MAEEKKILKFQMMMAPGEAGMLDDWMFKNRLRSRAEAIRRLCQIGLAFDAQAEVLFESMAKSSSNGDALIALKQSASRKEPADLSQIWQLIDELVLADASAYEAVLRIAKVHLKERAKPHENEA